MTDKVLILGSGGREHVLAWKIAQSPLVQHVFVAPGNGGTRLVEKVSNIVVNIKDNKEILECCKTKKIDLVVIGPEDPLANGIVDELSAAGIKCFGPSKKAAKLESSKAFAKAFMEKYDIPTGQYKSFSEPEAAKKHIQSAPYEALVVKASGLSAGKGVVVADSREAATQAVEMMMKEKTLGMAGEIVVIEELLQGQEVSVLAFSDGKNVSLMKPAQDHKRAFENDKGPNTGGMGAYCPCVFVNQTIMKQIESDIIKKTVDAMREDGVPFVGVLFAGLMLTAEGPKVLEFNCRFGDPETQSILPLMESDLYPTLLACVNGCLPEALPKWKTNLFSVGIVLASQGYPGSSSKGKVITGLEAISKNTNTLLFHAGTALAETDIVTSGGRVLTVVALAEELLGAITLALNVVMSVKFEGAFFRKDIGQAAVQELKSKELTYKSSGVNISLSNTLVKKIKYLARETRQEGVIGNIGGFGGVFDLKTTGYKDPLLISGTDGVGTKLKIAHLMKIHKTIGIDLVAMCVNDIITQGAEPLFFLDYFSCGVLIPEDTEAVIASIVEGCKLANCTLLGGETAEMPGMYATGGYDIAGFTVGVVEREQLLPKIDDVKEGDVLIGLTSSGIHSNGYSLIRKLVEKENLSYTEAAPFDASCSLGEALLTPTKIYVEPLLPVMRQGLVKAAAHITGGGLIENIPRVLPPGFGVVLDASAWKLQPVFQWIAKTGKVSEIEMLRTFNCGLGMVLIVSSDHVQTVLDLLKARNEEGLIVGNVRKVGEGDSLVEVTNISETLRPCAVAQRRKKVGVLISGSGTNLQALIDHSKNPATCIEIVLVLSNKEGVQGLKRAEKANIPTKVISNKNYKLRVDFDMAMHETLQSAGVEIVCLAGFMRILSSEFVKLWEGRLINIHPSLLPSFRGSHAHRQVLEAGVRITGCTVHFVVPEVDAGPIILQEAAPVFPSDTEEVLENRVKSVEHKIYPRALELLAQDKVVMESNGKVVWKL
ncbi:trifunctional purine biosynthetic protein adenosine-3-like isoform X1 [Limulus polyphemus]|uniref:Trifunctional purine biosynthetic protein adenosine-3 n=1 Tax=Limulus polyphemus TaxID=6850 RepID=A0ABM1SWE6_LIMPO|nr:trifunctional purine biosynthetic protein adenosine-3-like isoform X1 [Limulus polyphemus]XP_022247951.1 trifunctional purine biosynthetic protein adenosine-3-like isoform X1 [Limulus polyphemus]XP_022247952.1 trifunctional purine biosynthetic protein adenosine-3-like isoform X1 [Limulus polyphemus]